MKNFESIPGVEFGPPEQENPEQKSNLSFEEVIFEKIIKTVDETTAECRNGKELDADVQKELKEQEVWCMGRLVNGTQEESKIAAQLLAKFYAHPGLFYGNSLNAKIEDLCANMEWEKWGADAKDMNSSDRQEKFTARTNNLFKEVFSHYGLDAKEMVRAWRDGIFPMENKGDRNNSIWKQRELVMRNLETLQVLEFKRPGSASVLAKEFGVMDFGRYSPEMLINQYDEKDDLEHPYGVIISARRDYNGALYNGRSIYNDLSNRIHDKCRVRVLEAGGKFGLTRSLLKLDKKYGEKQKISFGIINAHGSEKSVVFGDWSTNSPAAGIKKVDIQTGKGLERIKDFFTDYGTIILDTCLSGAKGGIGQYMFEKFGVRVLGIDKTAEGISEIKTSFNGDRIDFKVKFATNGWFSQTRMAREYK